MQATARYREEMKQEWHQAGVKRTGPAGAWRIDRTAQTAKLQHTTSISTVGVKRQSMATNSPAPQQAINIKVSEQQLCRIQFEHARPVTFKERRPLQYLQPDDLDRLVTIMANNRFDRTDLDALRSLKLLVSIRGFERVICNYRLQFSVVLPFAVHHSYRRKDSEQRQQLLDKLIGNSGLSSDHVEIRSVIIDGSDKRTIMELLVPMSLIHWVTPALTSIFGATPVIQRRTSAAAGKAAATPSTQALRALAKAPAVAPKAAKETVSNRTATATKQTRGGGNQFSELETHSSDEEHN